MLGAILLGSGGHRHNQYSKKQVKHNPDMRKYILFVWGCSKGSLWRIFQESIVWSITKYFYGNDAIIKHIMCELEDTVNITKNIQILLRIMIQERNFSPKSIF